MDVHQVPARFTMGRLAALAGSHAVPTWRCVPRWPGSPGVMPFHQIIPCTPEHVPIKWFVHRCIDVRVTAVAVLAVTAVQTAALLPLRRMFSQWSGGPISEPFDGDVYYILEHVPVIWFHHLCCNEKDMAVVVLAVAAVLAAALLPLWHMLS